MLFLGTSSNKLDAKGRVSVPSDFRDSIAAEDFKGVVLYRSFTGRCIEGCALSRMEEISDAADTLDLFGEAAQNINSLIFSDARKLPFDVAGRIVIPPDLGEFAGLSGEALFVGRGKTFQIWSAPEFNLAQDAARDLALEIRPSLVIPR